MNKERVYQIFKESGVLLEGHFKLTSGKHSAKYLQCARVFQYPHFSEELTRALAKKFSDQQIDIVIGPAIGGIILSYEMGRCLNVKTLFAEREDGVMTLRRGFEIPKGSKVLVVEDVITTGGSVKEVINLIDDLGSEVVGVGALVDRSNGKADFGTKFEAVISLEVETYEPDNCPLCKNNISIIKPGSRK